MKHLYPFLETKSQLANLSQAEVELALQIVYDEIDPAGGATTTQVEGTPGRSVAVAGSNVINAAARARGEPAPVDQKCRA